MHTDVIYRRRANIDSIVMSVLLTVGGMMNEDPKKRPDAWKVYEDLTRAVDQAIPPTPGPITRPAPHDEITRPPAQGNYRPHSMPVNSSPNQTVGLNISGLSLQSRRDTHGGPAYHPPSRRSTVNGHPSPASLSGASSIGKGKAPRRYAHSPPADTIHEWQRTPLAPLRSPIPQPHAPAGQKARPSASIAQVLEHIRKKKDHLPTTLPGEEWLNRLHGRDQVLQKCRMTLGAFADEFPTDFSH